MYVGSMGAGLVLNGRNECAAHGVFGRPEGVFLVGACSAGVRGTSVLHYGVRGTF